MKVGQSSCDVGHKGESKSPGKRLGFVVDVLPEVTTFDELGDDEDATVRGRGARQSKIQYDVGMPCLPASILSQPWIAMS